MYSRRDFTKFVLAAGASAPLIAADSASTVNGVRLGVITYCFRSLPRTPDYLDKIVQACKDCGGGEIEVMSRLNVQPATLTTRDEIRNWRLTAPASFFSDIRSRFDAAGMNLFSYTNTFTDDFTDEELDKTFAAAKAMKAEFAGFTMAKVSSASRFAPFAKKYGLKVAFHNKPEPKDTNEIASPESFRKVLAMSPDYRINLDIGHFTAANFDAVETLRELHGQISHIHLKDRKRNGGANLPWGQGDTPIKQVLAMVRDNKWPLRCIAEYEYNGEAGPVEETRRCVDFARRALQS